LLDLIFYSLKAYQAILSFTGAGLGFFLIVSFSTLEAITAQTLLSELPVPDQQSPPQGQPLR
jgi:hypothetical protein